MLGLVGVLSRASDVGDLAFYRGSRRRRKRSWITERAGWIAVNWLLGRFNVTPIQFVRHHILLNRNRSGESGGFAHRHCIAGDSVA